MIREIFTISFFGFLSFSLPLFSLITWFLILRFVSPYFRSGFSRVAGWTSRNETIRYSSLALTPVIFATCGLIAAGFAVLFELMFMVGVSVFAADQEFILMMTLVSAGPIEECVKFLLASLLFVLVYYLGRKRKGGNGTVDGIICGLVVGASFGLLESFLYLAQGFSNLSSSGPDYITLDPILWRFILGVSIHAVFTGIATSGIGRKKWTSKISFTLLGLSIAIFMHSLNNGVQGIVALNSNMYEIGPVLLIDVIQIFLVALDFAILAVLWRRAKT